MRLIELLVPCALLFACGRSPEQSPPLHAPAPRALPEAELAPGSRLPDDTRPTAYTLELALDPGRPNYTGTATIDVELSRPRESIWLHSRYLHVSEVQVERSGAAPALTGKLQAVGESGLVALRLSQPVGPGPVRLKFTFEASFGKRLAGIYRAASEGKQYVFSQFEPISAREAFPCFDEPRFKAPFTVSLRVPDGHVAIANTPIREEKALEDGRRLIHFATTEKLPTYLVAFAVGPFDVVDAPPIAAGPVRDRAVPLRGVAVHGRGPDLAFALADTPPLLDWLEGYFGVPYPFAKLDLIAVPDFGAGAMENAGAITFRDTLLLVRGDAAEQQKRQVGYVNAHELAHQWFGDLVTMPWWDDIWLNEAFATWMGGKAVSAVHPEYETGLGALSSTHGAMEVDSRVAARKIRQPIESDHDIENAFDAITYSKGGAVLAMFERYLGTLRFQSGIRAYVEKYRFGSATAGDLMRSLAEAAEEPALEQAFASFLEQPGVPELQVQVDCKSNPPVLEATQRRYFPLGASSPAKAIWQVPVCVRFAEQRGGVKEQCTLLRDETAKVPLETEGCPRWLMPNAEAEGYYRFSLPAEKWTELIAQRTALTPREQMSLASNLSAAFRAGKLTPETLLTAQKALMASPERHVMETTLRTYWMVRELLGEPALPAFRAEVDRLLRPTALKLGRLTRAKPKESGEEKLRRAAVARALFGLVENNAVTAELAREGRALLDKKPGSEALPTELHEMAMNAALREDPTLFDRAEEQLFASSDGAVRARLLSAMACVRAPSLRERALSLSLDPRLRTNERLVPISCQSAMPETRKEAYAWLKAHFDVLLSQVGSHNGNDLIAVTAGLDSEEEARDVEAFFGPKSASIPGGPRELAMTLESIRTWSALVRELAPGLNARYKPRGAAKAAR